jgi:23S rRNA pseudouridine2605 synthase
MPEKTSPAKPVRAKAASPRSRAAPATAPAKTTEGERIAKVLSRAGISSRREAERLIEAGEVTVNGKIVTSPALNVTATDKITVSGQPVGAPEPARLWLYYKPEGLVTSAADEKGRDTVFDNLPEDMPRVMSIGRLDLNSEGLLLLTNDGALKRQLELPSTGWLRKYRVRVKGNPTEPELEPLRRGITVEGERFQPMEVKLDRHQGANAWLTVGLREGKNREIRRAMFAIGLTVNRLIRVSYGPFRLNEMQPGDVEEVKSRILRDQLGALMVGLAEAEDAAPPKRGTRGPKPAGATTVRTTGRTRSTTDDDRPAKSAPRRTATGDERAKPATPRAARPPSGDEDRPRSAKSRATAAGAKPGAISSPRGRKALGQLADAWVEATKPARRTSKDRDECDTAARSRPRSKTSAAKPSSRNAGPAAKSGVPKPPTRRK